MLTTPSQDLTAVFSKQLEIRAELKSTALQNSNELG